MKRTREAFDVRKEVFAVGKMCGEERNLLRKRFRAELVAVRCLLEKADRFLAPGAAEGCRGAAAPSSSSGLAALPGKEEGRFLGAEPRSDHVSMKADNGKATECRKTSPLAEHKAAPKLTPAEREHLAFSLAALAAELSDHAVELLPKQSHGGRREIEVNVCSMEDAVLFEIKMHVDKLVKRRDPSLPPQDDSKIVENEDENGRRVDICPGVSPVVTAPSPLQLEILEYAAVFDATGLVDKMLSPLPQKYLALAEKREECIAEKEDDEEYVDICGDASPVVFQNLIGAISQNPSIILSSDSESDSDPDIGSDSDSSDSGSVSHNHCDEKIGTPSPPVLPKVIGDSAPPSEPTLEVVHNGELKKLDSPAPAILPKVNGHSAGRRSEPAPVIQNAEPGKIGSPSPAVLHNVVDYSAPPMEAELEMVQNGFETEKLGSPTPSVRLLSKVNDGSSLLSSKTAPEVVQNAESEKLPHKPPARPMSELIAAALEKRRREERSEAREKARQDLVETERSAMTSHRVHPADMERLGILDIEHMVTQQRRPGVPPSLLQQLGLFLRADEDDYGEQQQQPISDPGVQDLEEGEIQF